MNKAPKNKKLPKPKDATKRPLLRSFRRQYTADFASRLKRTRVASRMTQAEVANLTGLQPSAIAHFEGGRRTPTIHNLCKLCVALGCQADYLLALSPGR